MRAITVFVCDQNGNGIYGKKVQEYNKEAQFTSSGGTVNLLIEEGSTEIYVEGSSAFRGYGNDAPNTLVYRM